MDLKVGIPTSDYDYEDGEMTPTGPPVSTDHSEFRKYNDDAFVTPYTGTTEDKKDPIGPTSGPKLAAPMGQGAMKGNKKTTGPGLVSLGKRKRRKTNKRKTRKQRRSHKTRAKKASSRSRSRTRRTSRSRSRR